MSSCYYKWEELAGGQLQLCHDISLIIAVVFCVIKPFQEQNLTYGILALHDTSYIQLGAALE